MSIVIRVVVTGALGRMGQEVVKAVLNEPDLKLIGAIDVKKIGSDIGECIGLPCMGIKVEGDLQKFLEKNKADVLVDFTNPEAVIRNAKIALSFGVSAVIGTTGLDEVDIEELKKASNKDGVGVLIAPNFALGAVLMMDFSRRAAKFFKNVEIIELHHDQKIDAPSGTALKTVQMIEQERKPFHQGHPEEYEKIPGVRGGDWNGIKIHSVRLPGLVAHQEVIFGGLGQILTIRHDSLNRESFMPGVILGIRKVLALKEVVIGLENILD